MCINDAFFDFESKRIEQMVREYTPRLDELRSACEKLGVRREFAVGGIHLHRGYYCPSPIDDIIAGNVKRGKLLKRLTTRSKPDCEFCFDIHNRLVLARSFFGDEIIFRDGTTEIGLIADENGIQYVSECEFAEGHIIKYLFAECSVFAPKQVKCINVETYAYSHTEFVADRYGWLKPTREALKMRRDLSKSFEYTPAVWSTHNRFVFTLKNGYFSEYTAWEYDGERLRESPYNGSTFQVRIERKV